VCAPWDRIAGGIDESRDHRQAGENLFVVVVVPEEVEGFNFINKQPAPPT
jgi:hypothetical protein